MKSIIDLNQYKLIISDLDGTILESGQPIHPFTKEILAKLPEFGIHFTLASGRNLASLRPYAEQLNIKIPMVLANGCIVQSLDRIIHHRITMPVEISRKVMEITDREDSDMVISIDDRLYHKKMTDNIFRVFGKLTSSIYEVGSWDAMEGMFEDINKFMIINWSSLEKLGKLEKIFESEIKSEADYLRTNIHHLEVMPKGVTKVTGLKYLADEMGIRMDEIIAFGDYENDAALLAEVGLGVAVENACDLAKQNADIIVGSCAENGPAIFLDQLMCQK